MPEVSNGKPVIYIIRGTGSLKLFLNNGSKRCAYHHHHPHHCPHGHQLCSDSCSQLQGAPVGFREGNDTPLQYSCLKNPMDGGAWWAAVRGVTKSQIQLSDFTFTFTFMHGRRKWQPTPVLLPGDSQGRGSLVGCRLWGRTESDTTEVT